MKNICLTCEHLQGMRSQTKVSDKKDTRPPLDHFFCTSRNQDMTNLTPSGCHTYQVSETATPQEKYEALAV